MSTKSVNGKRKGSSFERTVSVQLSKWLSGGERDDLFWRSQNSGGRHTSRKRQCKATAGQCGDIASTHPDSKSFSDVFVVECKHYRDLGLWSLLTGSGPGLRGFYGTVCQLAAEEGRHPLLVARQNCRPPLVLTDQWAKCRLVEYFGVHPRAEFRFFHLGETVQVAAYLWSDWTRLDPEGFRRLLEKEGNA